MADTTQDTTEQTQESVGATQQNATSGNVENAQVTAGADQAENDEGKGSKAAVLADLATERDKRQAAETLAQENDQKLTAVLQALGLADKGAEVDPDQLGKDLASQRAENAVLRAGNGIADVDALLDSRAFTQTLDTIDPSDRDAVKAHITEYVTANPRFAVATQKAQGVRDAAAGADRQTADTGDWIRNAARKN